MVMSDFFADISGRFEFLQSLVPFNLSDIGAIALKVVVVFAVFGFLVAGVNRVLARM